MQSEFVYRKAAKELFSLVDKAKVRDITSQGMKGMVLVSNICFMLRGVVERSSVSTFNGVIYCFTGRIYEPFAHKEDFDNMVYELWTMLGLPKPVYDTYTQKILKIMRDMVYSKDMHPDNTKVVFDNGVFDVDRKMFSTDVDKSTVAMSVLPYKFNAKAACVNWQMFLDVVLPVKDYQKILQEFLGSIFVDRTETKIETMLILKGDGANGKSVVFETVMGVLGRNNVSNLGVSELISGVDKKKNIAFINGKRLNYCPEINAFRISRESDTLKALISGEPLAARALYGNNFTAYDIPLLMSNCNKLPYMSDWSNGMRRRLTVLPFNVTIPLEKQNPMLAVNLQQEYSGIFNWIMEGRDRFMLQGCRFTESAELKKYYMDQVSHSGAVEDNTPIIFMYDRRSETKRWSAMLPIYTKETLRKPVWQPLTSLYMIYNGRWCKARHRKPVTRTMFKELLLDAGFQYEKRANGYCFQCYMVRDKDRDYNL
jgi:putative DNA primase/helicase